MVAVGNSAGGGHLVATNDEERKPTVKAWIQGIGSANRWILGIGGVATALGAIFTLVFMLVPGLKPEPSPGGKATLSDPRVVPNVTLREYLQRPGVPGKAVEDAASRSSEEELERVGSIIYYDVELVGLKGEDCYVRWSVYDANTGEPIEGLIDQRAWPVDLIRPLSQDNKTRQETWVPFPQYSQGPFLVSVELYTPVGETQVRRDSVEVTINTQG